MLCPVICLLLSKLGLPNNLRNIPRYSTHVPHRSENRHVQPCTYVLFKSTPSYVILWWMTFHIYQELNHVMCCIKYDDDYENVHYECNKSEIFAEFTLTYI